MINLTFGEQVKIVLSRKDMTIKELAEEIEARTGKKMSRQNLTQRLGRDNFQEQDMRMIADILGCPFQLSILGNADSEKEALDEEEMPTGRELEKLTAKKERKAAREEAKKNVERDITVGEIVDILEETTAEPKEEAVQMELDLDAEEQTARETESVADSDTLEEDILTEEETEPYTEPAEDDVEVSAEDTEQIEEELQEPEQEIEAEVVEEAGAEEIPEETSEAAYQEEAEPQEEAYQEQPAYEENQPETYQEEETPAVEDAETEDVHEEKKSPFSKLTKLITPKKEKKSSGWPQDFQPIKRREDIDEDLVNGDVNPYTGHEYRTNSVRMHPHRIGYVQVYDRKDHKWTDMTEWAFLGVEERKKATMGKDYEPPIYLD
ncbi:hypothetical protein DXD67_08195 [Coprococcus comes]|uniref:Uncharacterized protein n=1 Tax=Coprococcus comes TaxID=410072 RepID=A0A3E4GQ34_9FIRM|nr:hypothetical protein [Coprococcus comes]RGJ23462.1 hypothetical protein DXD67_08195 [Coprococcus comes]